MTKNKKTGDWGEALAAEFLENKGYTIEERNYRYSRGEIDLIAKKDSLLIFVEVKTRSKQQFGYPEEWVDQHKEEWIFKVADHYTHEIDWEGAVRFDIIAILKNDPIMIDHFEDVFY